MNITGGANLSLYEVQEAADIVASASDPEVNMIFGSVINEGLKDDIVVTVIATGFDDSIATQPPKPIIRPNANHTQQQQQPVAQPSKQREVKREMKREEPVVHERHSDSDDIDIPAFYVTVVDDKKGAFMLLFVLNGKDLLSRSFYLVYFVGENKSISFYEFVLLFLPTDYV